MKLIFTTGMIAKLLSCSNRTVGKWIDRGWLKGYYLPLSRDRRVLRSDLVEFLLGNGMPNLEELESLHTAQTCIIARTNND